MMLGIPKHLREKERLGAHGKNGFLHDSHRFPSVCSKAKVKCLIEIKRLETIMSCSGRMVESSRMNHRLTWVSGGFSCGLEIGATKN